jgi:hypothetical protein
MWIKRSEWVTVVNQIDILRDRVLQQEREMHALLKYLDVWVRSEPARGARCEIVPHKIHRTEPTEAK